MATETAQNTKFTGAFELFGKSKDLIFKHFSLFWPPYAILLFFQLFSMLATNTSDKDPGTTNIVGSFGGAGTSGLIGLGIGVFILTLVVMIVVQAMLYILSLKVTDGKKTNFTELWAETKKYWLRLLGLGIVYGVLLIVGLVLLIVPGLIVLRRYYLSQYYLIDKDLSIGEAMKQSAAESKQHSGSVWGVIGVTILIGFANVIPKFGSLISFVLLALYSVAPAIRYREIRTLSSSGDR